MKRLFAKLAQADVLGDDHRFSSGGVISSGTNPNSNMGLPLNNNSTNACPPWIPSQTQQQNVFIGKQFSVGRYYLTVEDIIAEGGFALVFKVVSQTDQIYALKRMLVNNQHDLRMCKQEITIVSSLSHKNILHCVDSCVTQLQKGIHEILLLTAYCPGSVIQLMNDKLSNQQRFSEVECLRIFCDMCDALSRLHHCQTPIIHRDLKIENILIDERSNYILCDFGSCTARVMYPAQQGFSKCEEEIAKYTTLSYRSPEMIDLYSGKAIGTPSDIWAMGCLLYRLCYFALPFGESSLAIQSGNYSIPDKSDYSEQMHKLINYMLIVDPDQRPDIFQVSSLAFDLAGQVNPVQNINQVNVPSWSDLKSPLKESELKKIKSNPSHRGPSPPKHPAITIPSTVSDKVYPTLSSSTTISTVKQSVVAKSQPPPVPPSTKSSTHPALIVPVSTSVTPRQRPRPHAATVPVAVTIPSVSVSSKTETSLSNKASFSGPSLIPTVPNRIAPKSGSTSMKSTEDPPSEQTNDSLQTFPAKSFSAYDMTNHQRRLALNQQNALKQSEATGETEDSLTDNHFDPRSVEPVSENNPIDSTSFAVAERPTDLTGVAPSSRMFHSAGESAFKPVQSSQHSSRLCHHRPHQAQDNFKCRSGAIVPETLRHSQSCHDITTPSGGGDTADMPLPEITFDDQFVDRGNIVAPSPGRAVSADTLDMTVFEEDILEDEFGRAFEKIRRGSNSSISNVKSREDLVMDPSFDPFLNAPFNPSILECLKSRNVMSESSNHKRSSHKKSPKSRYKKKGEFSRLANVDSNLAVGPTASCSVGGAFSGCLSGSEDSLHKSSAKPYAEMFTKPFRKNPDDKSRYHHLSTSDEYLLDEKKLSNEKSISLMTDNSSNKSGTVGICNPGATAILHRESAANDLIQAGHLADDEDAGDVIRHVEIGSEGMGEQLRLFNYATLLEEYDPAVTGEEMEKNFKPVSSLSDQMSVRSNDATATSACSSKVDSFMNSSDFLDSVPHPDPNSLVSQSTSTSNSVGMTDRIVGHYLGVKPLLDDDELSPVDDNSLSVNGRNLNPFLIEDKTHPVVNEHQPSSVIKSAAPVCPDSLSAFFNSGVDVFAAAPFHHRTPDHSETPATQSASKTSSSTVVRSVLTTSKVTPLVAPPPTVNKSSRNRSSRTNSDDTLTLFNNADFAAGNSSKAQRPSTKYQSLKNDYHDSMETNIKVKKPHDFDVTRAPKPPPRGTAIHNKTNSNIDFNYEEEEEDLDLNANEERGILDHCNSGGGSNSNRSSGRRSAGIPTNKKSISGKSCEIETTGFANMSFVDHSSGEEAMLQSNQTSAPVITDSCNQSSTICNSAALNKHTVGLWNDPKF